VIDDMRGKAWAATVYSPKQHFVFTVYKSTSIGNLLFAYDNLPMNQCVHYWQGIYCPNSAC
jgi:hypothetical protein